MDENEFLKTFDRISKIGWSEKIGTNRLALNEYDIQARKELVSELHGIGSDIRIDDAGNIYGIIGKERNSIIAVGSHMDSVPDGGRFDGMYGVMAGLQVLKEYSRKNFNGALILIDFTNEEGARWQPDLQGSGMATGVFEKDFIYSRIDNQGLKFGDVLKNSGFMGEESQRIKNIEPDFYIEPHIEQGPVLEKEGYDIGIPLGIVTDIVNRFIFVGEANQAGPTPMDMRKDALVAASIFISRINEIANKLSPKIVMTVGEIINSPNVYSVIPSMVELKLDIRTPDKDLAYQKEKEAFEIAKEISEKMNVSLKIEKGWSLETIHFDEDLIKIIERSCRELNLKYKFVYSWATHDAMYMNRITRTAMIFIPSHNGRSHTREEYSSDRDMINGLNVLRKTVEKLL